MSFFKKCKLLNKGSQFFFLKTYMQEVCLEKNFSCKILKQLIIFFLGGIIGPLKPYNVNQGKSDFIKSNCLDLKNIICIISKIKIIIEKIGVPGKFRHK